MGIPPWEWLYRLHSGYIFLSGILQAGAAERRKGLSSHLVQFYILRGFGGQILGARD